MVNNEFYWYEIDDTNKVGNQVIIPLELSDVKKAIGLYLVNPIERSKIKDLDKLIRNIERNTKVNMISDDDNEKWSDDKMGFFREDLLNPAYQDIMNSRLKELLQTYVPNEEKRKWESFEDFKTTDIDSKLTLGDLLDSNEEKEFIGETIVVGRSDKSTTQKKLLDNERMLTNDEFFGLKPRDDAVLSSINVKYTDAGIDVKFTVDQTSGKIPRKIFEDAGFKKVVFKDDPTSYGGSIRDKYSPNWNDMTTESTFSQSRDQGTFDPLSIWVGEGKRKQKSREEYTEKLEGRFKEWKDKALEMLAGLKGRIDGPKKKLEQLKEELKTAGSTKENMYGVELGTKRDKDIGKEIKDLEEFLNYIENNHKRLWEGNTTFSQERRRIKKLTGKVLAEYISGQAQSVGSAKEGFQSDRVIELENDEIATIKESWTTFKDEEIEDKNDIRKIVEEMIKDGRMLQFLKGRSNRSPWFLHRSTITLIIHPDNLRGQGIYVPSKGKIDTTKMISKEILTQPAQMKTQRQRKQANLPVSRRAGGGATKVTQDSETAKLGVNAARKWWFRKFNIRHNKLKRAAQSIGANLEA